jgi:hypothetical protein
MGTRLFSQGVMRLLLLMAVLLACGRGQAAVLEENFASDPAPRGWKRIGNPALFAWNGDQPGLRVTWDSSQSNSFFLRPLETILTAVDEFSAEIAFSLDSIAIGVDPTKPRTFQIAAGFVRIRDVTGEHFVRGSGLGSTNLVEFNYFPDSGFGATVSPVIVTQQGRFFPSFSFPIELTPGKRYRVRIHYLPTERRLRTLLFENETEIPIRDAVMPPGGHDFRVDAFALASYSHRGADGSIFAVGTVDSIRLEWPEAELDLRMLRDGDALRITFSSHSNWEYQLEQSLDLIQWHATGPVLTGNGEVMSVETNAVGPSVFFRVRADRP